MANGEHLGQCPTCGGHQWWDNRARKAIGELSRSQPDYVCTVCRHGRWIDGRQRSGWAAPTGRRAPSVRVTAVAPVVDRRTPSPGAAPVQRRSATGHHAGMARCGSSFCGPRYTAAHRARDEPVPRHDQGWPAVPGWRCSWNPLLPATRTPTLTETVGSSPGRGRRRPVAGRLRRTTTCRSVRVRRVRRRHSGASFGRVTAAGDNCDLSSTDGFGAAESLDGDRLPPVITSFFSFGDATSSMTFARWLHAVAELCSASTRGGDRNPVGETDSAVVSLVT